jgi:patatin-like phospholipase/acyl hydrolase
MADTVMQTYAPKGHKKGEPYRILVIAGGGVYGAVPAAFLAKHFKDKPLTDTFHCFGGTSIGGILTMCYASGQSPQDILHAFSEMAPMAFPRRKWYERINPFKPSFDGKGLEKALRKMLPMDVGDLKRPVVVPTMDFEYNRPKVIDTLICDQDGDMPAWEVGMATAAAPTYFPPYKRFIDGGLVSNVPILETAAAVHHKMQIPYEDMHILVMGTGSYPRFRRNMDKVKRWAKWKWVMPIINLAVKANEMRSYFLARQMHFGRLEIFDPVTLERDWDMDKPELVPVLMSMADNFSKAFDEAYARFK